MVRGIIRVIVYDAEVNGVDKGGSAVGNEEKSGMRAASKSCRIDVSLELVGKDNNPGKVVGMKLKLAKAESMGVDMSTKKNVSSVATSEMRLSEMNEQSG